jgi:signal transduction histidine kinase
VFSNSWRAYRPPATDVAIAAAFVVVGQLVTWGRLDEPTAFVGPRVLNAALNLLLMAALAWRRRAPLAAVCWTVTVYFLPQAVVQHDLTLLAGAVPLIVLTASAGYYCPRRRAFLAAAIAMVGLTTVTLATPYLSRPDYFAWNVVFLLGPWLAARGLREREDRAAALGAVLAGERATKDAALREVAASERVRIARELHDIVAHSVSVMLVQIGAARMHLRAGAGGAEAPLLAAEDVGRQALAELRRLLGVLRADEAAADGLATGPQPPQPGLSALDALVAQTRAAGLLVEVQVEADPVELPAGLDLTAYRIVQDALTNTLKHGGAAHASVRLVYTPSGHCSSTSSTTGRIRRRMKVPATDS